MSPLSVSLESFTCSYLCASEDKYAQVDADVELNEPEEKGLSVEVKVLSVPENVAMSEDEES